MAKQKCGTCRFFQEAGLAGSGWCHHPERKTSNGVMIMVRRNELACRNEWQRSLWAPRDGEPGDEPTFQRAPTMGPVAPATADHLRALLATDHGMTPEAEGEDVLLSEARIVSDAPTEPEPVLASARAKPLASSAPAFDARSAVFRAREAYRERNRAKSMQERQSIRAQSVSSESRSRGTFVGAVAADQPEARLSQSGMAAEHHPIMPAPVVHALPDEDSEREQARAAERSEPFEVRPEHIERDRDRLPANRSTRAAAADEQPVPRPGGSELDVCPAEPAKPEPGDEAAVAHPRGVEEAPLPAWFRTDLPRVCRACRDFRPSADGQRGWCANDWAFTHSRLVHADDLAPCQSAIGDWWVPVDDVWLVAADVSSHGRPTPLLDRLLGDESRKRKRS